MSELREPDDHIEISSYIHCNWATFGKRCLSKATTKFDNQNEVRR